MTIKQNNVFLALLAATCLSLTACGGGNGSDQAKVDTPPSNPAPPPPPPTTAPEGNDGSHLTAPEADRDWLMATELFSEEYLQEGPIHNGYFVPVGNVNTANHTFAGTIKLNSFTVSIKEAYGDATNQINFPDVEMSFVSTQIGDNGVLLPTHNGFIEDANQGPYRMLINPGKTWSEPDDNGWSRASFPFVLVVRDSNETHNGLATFLYNDTEMSRFRFQVVQETTAWLKIDRWLGTTRGTIYAIRC